MGCRWLLAGVLGLIVPFTRLAAASGGYPITLGDALGAQVRLGAPPIRIVSLAPSITEILFAVGAGGLVVGVTDFCDYPPEARFREKIGGFSNPSLEKIAALNPDLVLAARHNPRELLDRLRDLGTPVFALNPSTVDEVAEAVGTVGRLTGRGERADSLAFLMRSRIQAVVDKVRDLPTRPRVLWCELKAPTYSAGRGSFIGDLIELAGGTNLAADAGVTWPQLGLEAIVAMDPEVILTSSDRADELPSLVASLRQRAGWGNVTAVRQGAVRYVDLDLIGRPGPRIVDGLLAIAQAIYPELFRSPGRGR